MLSAEEFVAGLEEELPRLRRAASRMAPAGMEPDDLVQDVLERAWRAREVFRGDARLSTWLHRILMNRATDLGARSLPQAATLDGLNLISLTVGDPAGIVEKAENRQWLRAAMSTLGVEDKMVLVLHDGEGWSAAQITQLSGWSSAAVYKRIQRARLRLIQALSETPGVIAGQSQECRDARGHLGQYFDGTLELRIMETVDEHLQSCRDCPPLAQALVGLRAALARDAPVPATGAGLADAIRLLRLEASSLQDQDGR